MTRRIAVISEHACPLAASGGVDAGGQNVYVGEVSKHLATLGYEIDEIDTFTRRDSELVPEPVEWVDGVRVTHGPAGPPRDVRKEDMLPFMREFIEFKVQYYRRGNHCDLLHASFLTSGLVTAELKRLLDIPFVVTFHAQGRVRRMHQGVEDAFPDARFEIEDRVVAEANRVIAECPQDREDLICRCSASQETSWP